MKTQKTLGFTLVELLVVIAIIAILALVVFVALDPATRFQDARDSVRATAVEEMLSAVKLDQVDNGGTYLASIAAMTAGETYMVVNGALMVAGCDDNNAACDTNVTGDAHCVNIAGLLTEGYVAEMPISPAGTITWDDGNAVGEEGSGYTMSRDATGVITVRACESENTTEISVAR